MKMKIVPNSLKCLSLLVFFILFSACFYQKNIMLQEEFFSFDIPTYYGTKGVILYQNKKGIKGALFLVDATREYTKFYMDWAKTKPEKLNEAKQFLLKEVYFLPNVDTSFCFDAQTKDSLMFFHYPKSMYKQIKHHMLSVSDTSFSCFGYTWQVGIAKSSLYGDYGLTFRKSKE